MPRPSLLLTAAAITFFAAGISLLFAPEELLRLAGTASSAVASVVLQVLGSAFFGFGLLNWMTRYSRMDGIFGRPLLVANLGHTLSGALSLAHVAIRGNHSAIVLIATAVYTCLAVAFGSRFFSSGPKDVVT